MRNCILSLPALKAMGGGGQRLSSQRAGPAGRKQHSIHLQTISLLYSFFRTNHNAGGFHANQKLILIHQVHRPFNFTTFVFIQNFNSYDFTPVEQCGLTTRRKAAETSTPVEGVVEEYCRLINIARLEDFATKNSSIMVSSSLFGHRVVTHTTNIMQAELQLPGSWRTD